MNDANLTFYENLGIDPFKELAIKGGFNSFVDLELAYPYLKESNSILEIGAGYGRCIDFFLEKKFQGTLIGIEQSTPMVAHLEKKYKEEIKKDKVKIYKVDAKNLNLSQKVDAAIWMWSGIIDFSPEEQKKTISLISDHLTEKGALFIDIPRIGFRTYAEHKDLQNLHLDTPFGSLNCYIPDLKDIQKYSSVAGFNKITSLDYKTTTDKERTLYILHKYKCSH
ncbi:class I SAM-dependent methyltransferase [Cytophagaceae bacterium ABcell3]|nr:class I SAM-dependent methyltransferase [Cytophagaceae bacterium ABcell3]